MTQYLKELLVHNSLLKLTREHPDNYKSIEKERIHNLTVKLLDVGVLLIEPDEPTSIDIVLSSGIHGNETAPIEICDELVSKILKGELSVHNRLLIIIGNPPAMNLSVRFVDENLNRLFCGKHAGKEHPEAVRASNLERYVSGFYTEHKERFHFDLHTAIRESKYEKFAIYPYQDGGEYNKEAINFLKDSGINTILLANQPAGTFAYYTSHEFSANSFTVELGKVKPFGENNMLSFSKIIQSLSALISNTYETDTSFNNEAFNLFQVVDEVMRTSATNFFLHIDKNISNFSTFPLGFQLTTDDNGGYQISSKDHAIVFPNADVPVGNRVALIVNKTII